MSRDLNSSIDIYIEHFRSKVKRLREYELHPEDLILKKNILVSILDALSRTTSNNAAGNRERFTGIVANFGDWPDHTRVSAPHIIYLLRKLREPAYENVKKFIADTIQKNSDGRLVRLSDDPELNDIKELWPVSAEKRVVDQYSLSSFTHLNLLYQYRNSIIHELREPGYGMEFSDDNNEPYYHGMTSSASDDSVSEESLELVYPLDFYFRLTESVITNLEQYLHNNRVDPYSFYRFGSSWVGLLNI